MSTNEPVRILHVVRRAEGGILAHVSALFSGLDVRFAQSLASTRDVKSSLPAAARVAGFLEVDIGDNSGPRTFLQALWIARFARENGTQVIHAHGYKAALPAVFAAKLSGCRAIVTCHNMFPANASLPARMSLRMASRLASQMIAVSESLAGSLKAAGADARKIRVVPGGIDVDSCRSGRREALRQPLGLQEGVPVVLTVARLTEVKGVEHLIRAVSEVHRERPDARFLIAGDGPDRGVLERMAEETAPGVVVFLGFRNDVHDLLAAADVVCVPSLAEGYGLMAVEAMAAGKAVVASRVGGLADNITDGETGVLVPPADSHALAEALLRLIGSPEERERLGEAASQRAGKDFTIEKMIERTAEVYLCAVS